MRKSKKGQVFQQIGALGVGIATLAIVLVVALLIVAEGRDQIEVLEGVASNTTSYNSTITLANAISTIPAWIPLVVVAAIGAILLGLIAMFKSGR